VKVLVTGGAGFIGSHLVDAYLAAGHQVAVLDDLSSGRRENLAPRATFHQMDVRDPRIAEVFAAEKPELVNHHAAQIDVRKAVENPRLDVDINVVGALNLLEQCVRFGVRKVIFASTGGAIYGELERMPADESHPVRPLSPYGIDKHVVEHYLRFYRETRGLEFAALRYANVCGPRQDPRGEAGVVAIFTDAMLAGKTPTIYGDGEQVRDFVYVGDVVAANLLASEREAPQPVNIGTGVATSINRIYAILAAIIEFPHGPIYAPGKAGDVRRSALDARLAREVLGWRPRTPLEEALRLTVEWFRGRGDRSH
jgi:UDP-glucose 4-epimerase